jgi:hypothetical protein
VLAQACSQVLRDFFAERRRSPNLAGPTVSSSSSS